VRNRSIRIIFAAMTAMTLTLALAVAGFGQAAAPAGQRGTAPAAQAPAQPAQGGAAPAADAGGRGGRGGGQRGGAAAAPAAPAPPTPRRPDGKPIMGSLPGQTGRWSGCCTTLGQGILDKIPFQPWAKAVYDQRQIDQFEPHTRCKASGASRQFSTPYGTEMLEMPDLQRIYILDVGGPHSFRIIYMDGRSHPANLVPTNYGHSIGRWEGDTLVVDTVGFNEKFWIDTRGTPHTSKLHFVERFTRVDFNTLQYQATIDDPGAYTATWSTPVFTMRFNANSEMFEYICQDNNRGPELMIGSQESVDRSRLFVP
jgi:hypothetical protein